MGKYRIYNNDLIRDITIQENVKNKKLRVFKVLRKKNKLVYKPISKEYKQISNIAPEQNKSVYVNFIAGQDQNKYLLLNTNKVIKIRKYRNKINKTDLHRDQELVKLNNEVPSIKYKWGTEIYKQKDGAYLFRNKKFGEILWDNAYGKVSESFGYIGDPDNAGYRIVKISNNTQKNGYFAYLNPSYTLCDEPFKKFVNNQNIESICNGLELVYNGKKFYFLNENHKRCSEKYDYIEANSNTILALLSEENKYVFLDNQAQEKGPHFFSFEQLGKNFALYIDKTNIVKKGEKLEENVWVVFNPNIEKNNTSPKLTNITICPKHNIVSGTIKKSGRNYRVVINADNPEKYFVVDKKVEQLMMNYLNNQPFGKGLVTNIINNKTALENTLEAFNECINLSLPKEKHTPITHRYNVCSKFLTKIKQNANGRLKRCDIRKIALDEELPGFDQEYTGKFIKLENEYNLQEQKIKDSEQAYLDELAKLKEEHERKKAEELARLEQLKKDKKDTEEEYLSERAIKEKTVDKKLTALEKKKKKNTKYKTYVEEVKVKNPNAKDVLNEDSEENEKE